MPTKRYTIKPQDDLFGVVDNYSADKECVINGIRTEIEAEWLCNKMNTLNDENERLKQIIADWETSFDLLKDKKEQLQKELKVHRKLANCGNCHHHNYDWFDDGDEFEVCDKGNDVTEGICEEWVEL